MPRESESIRYNTLPIYPWWEEQQCVLDSQNVISDIEELVKDQLQAHGWPLEENEQDASGSLSPPHRDANIRALLYIHVIEIWLDQEVEDADGMDLIDEDFGP